ncbi:DUF5412 family protein [Lysinibacillus fusiformis]
MRNITRSSSTKNLGHFLQSLVFTKFHWMTNTAKLIYLSYKSCKGATTSYSICGLVFNHKRNIKNWNNREGTEKIIWIDNNTVVINGHTLDVSNDKFNFRKQ